jgi:toxin ParE1/3/4
MNFILAPSAIKDLDRISEYFLEKNVEAGEKLFREFNRRFTMLTQFPKSGRVYANIDPALHGLTVDGYIIFYRVTSTEVEIVRVVNGRQDLPALFR